VAQRPSRPDSNRSPRPRPDTNIPESPASQPTEPPGVLGHLSRNNRLMGGFNLVAAILLLFFTIQGFAGGRIYFPIGYGLMALYFFYSYARNGLKVNFGSLTAPLNLVLLIGALVCLVLGIQNESK
jgi:hypothetical protein